MASLNTGNCSQLGILIKLNTNTKAVVNWTVKTVQLSTSPKVLFVSYNAQRIVKNIRVSFISCCLLYMFGVIWFLDAFGKLRKAAISFVVSVCSLGTTRLPLEGFSWNFTSEDFAKICREIPSFIKIWQE